METSRRAVVFSESSFLLASNKALTIKSEDPGDESAFITLIKKSSKNFCMQLQTGDLTSTCLSANYICKVCYSLSSVIAARVCAN